MTDKINLKKEVGGRIKEARKNTSLTQKEVASILRMTQQQYSRFENGIFELDYLGLIEISKLYDVSVDFLLGLNQA